MESVRQMWLGKAIKLWAAKTSVNVEKDETCDGFDIVNAEREEMRWTMTNIPILPLAILCEDFCFFAFLAVGRH